jgi:hypothetical protein
MAKEKKKRGIFKKSKEVPVENTAPEVTPENTPEVASENTTEVAAENVDIFSEIPESTPESQIENTPEPEVEQAPEPVVEKPVFHIPEKPKAVKVETPSSNIVIEQKEAAPAPVVETPPAPQKIEDMLNQVSIPEQFSNVSATSNHSDEMKLEKFLRMRKGPTPNVVYQGEVMSSGINMSSFGLLEGRVGKFKLKRNFISEAWTITIQ